MRYAPEKRREVLFLLLTGLEFFAIAVFYLFSRSEADRAFLWGYSMGKLFFILFLSLISFILWSAAFRLMRGKSLKVDIYILLKITNVQYILFFAGALGWIILFTPLELFGYFKNYLEEAK